jgi:hypothetical protein
MSIPITDSQLTKVYLVATSVATSTAAEITTAIAGGKQIGCLQDVGAITTSRAVQEYKCLSSDETAKSLGSITLPNISMNLLFDADDAAGQAELRTMYANKERRKMIVVLNDTITPSTGTPTSITFEAALSSDGVTIAIDSAVMYNATVEICSKPIMIKAT